MINQQYSIDYTEKSSCIHPHASLTLCSIVNTESHCMIEIMNLNLLRSDAEIASLAAHVEIRGGYSFRGKVPDASDGEIGVIQIRDIDHEAKRLMRSPVRVKRAILSRLDDHLLTRDEVLLVARGSYITAVVVENHVGPSIASASFLIIRPDQHFILPSYLAWYLNQEQTQSYLVGRLGGSAIPLLNKTSIEDLPIIIPSLSIQQELTELVELVWQEELLARHLKTLRHRQLTMVAQNLLG